jgi:hypothetical protein
MAKGQLRGNREAKKPKQAKKVPAAPATGIVVPPRGVRTGGGGKG